VNAAEQIAALGRCISEGGVAVFPADTVYGLACDPECEAAVARLYELKGRPEARPAAVMFPHVDPVLERLALGPRSQAALRRLLPGPLTLLLPNPRRRFRLACSADPETIGVRVPDLPLVAGLDRALLQSSANLSGGLDARRLSDVPEGLRAGADLVIDGGELPGTPSTVVDLRGYETAGTWSVVRAGAVARESLERALSSSAR
jgi:L-threonylcarbamoyladenylate synthase